MIVPTWNEEGWLPALLTRLSRDDEVAEIVVADNSSGDQTVEIAKRFGTTVVAGGLPAVGRNEGARVATGSVLIFVDADVAVGVDTVRIAVNAFRDPETALVHFKLTPASCQPFVRLCYAAVDLYARLCSTLGRPQGSAPLICVRRDVFEKVGGFDETITAAEDVEFIDRVGRYFGGVTYLSSPPLQVSARRFALEQPQIYAAKCLLWGALRLLRVGVNPLSYRWLPYPKEVAEHDKIVTQIGSID